MMMVLCKTIKKARQAQTKFPNFSPDGLHDKQYNGIAKVYFSKLEDYKQYLYGSWCKFEKKPGLGECL